MRLSTSTNIMVFNQKNNYAVSIEDSVRACKEAGYKYIDANLCSQARVGQPMRNDDWVDWAYRLRALGDELDIEFKQSHAYWPLGNITNADDELGEELMRRSVIISEILGVKWMVTHPCTICENSLYSYIKSFRYNLDYSNRWAEFFIKHNVGMAIENMPEGRSRRTYCADINELIELIDTINDPKVGACLDTGHAHLSGLNLPEVILVIGNRLKATHIADNHQNMDEHIAPYYGTINWPEVMKALKDINYNEDFSFEIQNLTSSLPASIQAPLVRFSYTLGRHLLSLIGE